MNLSVPQARSQAGALGAIAPSAGTIAPSGASLCTLCIVVGIPGVPKKMYHICFAHSFHTFLRNLLKHTSKDSQIHGDLLTPPPDSVTRPWRSRCHVLEVSTVLGHAQRCSASGLLGLVSTCGGGKSPDSSTNSLVQDTYRVRRN